MNMYAYLLLFQAEIVFNFMHKFVAGGVSRGHLGTLQ
jgi:hypothetical protein